MTSHSTKSIAAKNVTFWFEGERQPRVKDVSFAIEKGENVFLLGPSGCGKSTLALCLNRLYPEAVDGTMKGEVWVKGRDLSSFALGEVNQQIGVVFQDPESQFCMLTVEEEIAFGLENQSVPRSKMEKKICEVLELVGLTAYRETYIHTLSGGQKQKLALACVLAMGPDIIILDEPTANLDPASSVELVETIRKIQRQKPFTMIVIEHQLQNWLPLMDRCLVLSGNGELIFDGTPRECFSTYAPFLQREGVWLPPTIQLAMNLMEKNAVNGPIYPLTVSELLEHVSLGDILLYGREKRSSLVGKPLIQVSNLSYKIREKQILEAVDFELREGEFVAMVGANGSGKTTFSKIITGLIGETEGEILVDGRKLNRWPEQELWHFIGYVFQNPEHQFITDSVYEEITFGMVGKDQEVVHKILEKMKLTAHLHHHPFMLSQGQKRRLSVATMLGQQQRVLILDEPTFGQDANTSYELMNVLKEKTSCSDGIVMITHDMELVHEYADRVVVLDGGKVVFNGTPEQLWRNDQLLSHAKLSKPFVETLRKLAEDKGVVTRVAT